VLESIEVVSEDNVQLFEKSYFIEEEFFQDILSSDVTGSELTILSENDNIGTSFDTDLEKSSVQTVQDSSPSPNKGVGKKRGRKLGYRSETTKDDSAVCQVCGGRAGRHSYYGGDVCQSCRAFFRRCVQRQTYHNLKCNKSCDITITNRKKCRSCRWRRCLESGMKISYVQFDPEENKKTVFKEASDINSISELTKLSDSLHQKVYRYLHCSGVYNRKADNLFQHHSLLIISKIGTLNEKQKHLLSSTSSQHLATLRKILFLNSTHYPRLYHPGWSVSPHIESSHQDQWTRVKNLVTNLDSEGHTLLQCVVLFSNMSHIQHPGLSASDKHKFEAEYLRCSQMLLEYCERYVGADGFYRSMFGNLVMIPIHIRQIQSLDQLRKLQ